jgi:hypothetical protein
LFWRRFGGSWGKTIPLCYYRCWELHWSIKAISFLER